MYKFLFDISFNFSNNDFPFDHNKENDFIDSRNSYLDNLKLYHIDKVELYKNINIVWLFCGICCIISNI